MRSLVLCAGLVAVLLPAGAVAQSQTLTEAEALARFSADSPRVRAIRSTIDVAKADVVAAGRWPNPRVTFDRESVAGLVEDMTTVTQPLPVTGRRGFEVRAASALAEATERRADDAIQRARADLRLAFTDLVSAQVREREFAAAEAHLRTLVEALARREAAGDAAGFDRLRAERDLVDVGVDVAAASVDRAHAQAALAGFFAGPLDASAIVADESRRVTPSALPGVDVLVQRAESTRGDLLALLRESDAAQFSVRAAGRRRLPEPELVAGTKRSNAGNGDVGGVLAVTATVPLFDRSRAERAAAEARGKLAIDRAAAMRVSLRAEIAALRAAAQARRETADAYRQRAVAGAGAIERIAQVGYDAGERTILELLDAFRIGMAARVRQAELDAAVRQAEVELEYVSGWEIP